jgi:tetratricopeptide (TPR) repeat protein
MIAEEQRDSTKARDWYKKSLEISQKYGDEHGMALTYHQLEKLAKKQRLGVIVQEQRDFTEAWDWYKKSLGIEQKHGDEHGMALTFHNLGSLAEEQRDFTEARDWYQKSTKTSGKVELFFAKDNRWAGGTVHSTVITPLFSTESQEKVAELEEKCKKYFSLTELGKIAVPNVYEGSISLTELSKITAPNVYGDFTFRPYVYPNQAKSNRWLKYTDYALTVVPQEKPIELEGEYYRGFSLAEWGELKVSYDKEDIVFFYNFKFVCLNRSSHNKFYPKPYLIICFELELEGIGESKEAALDDLCQLLDLYFNRMREVKDPKDYTKAIYNNINHQNSWKDSFSCIYKQAQKREKINADYQIGL